MLPSGAFAFDAQVALTLRTIGGLRTVEIARAFRSPRRPSKRLVRAKRKIAAAGIPFAFLPGAYATSPGHR